MKKKFLAMAACLLLALACLAGCSSDEKQGGAAGTTGNNDQQELTGWAYIENKGELIVGLDDAFAPMGFRDENGELVGFDIDLANAVGEKLSSPLIGTPKIWSCPQNVSTAFGTACPFCRSALRLTL